MSDHASSSTVAQVAQNSVFERFARAGYVVSGLLHLAIGYLAIRIALGSGGGSADQSGALAAVAAKPGGIVALWVAVGRAGGDGAVAARRNGSRSVDRPEIPRRVLGSAGSGEGLRAGGGLFRVRVLHVRVRPGRREVHRCTEFRISAHA